MKKKRTSTLERTQTFSPSGRERSSAPNKRKISRQTSLQSENIKLNSQTPGVTIPSHKSALPTDFAKLIKPTPFAKFSSKPITTVCSPLSLNTCLSEPSMPIYHGEISVSKVYEDPKTVCLDRPVLQGILKQRNESRFIKYNKKTSLYQKQKSMQRVKIAEGLEFIGD